MTGWRSVAAPETDRLPRTRVSFGSNGVRSVRSVRRERQTEHPGQAARASRTQGDSVVIEEEEEEKFRRRWPRAATRGWGTRRRRRWLVCVPSASARGPTAANRALDRALARARARGGPPSAGARASASYASASRGAADRLGSARELRSASIARARGRRAPLERRRTPARTRATGRATSARTAATSARRRRRRGGRSAPTCAARRARRDEATRCGTGDRVVLETYFCENVRRASRGETPPSSSSSSSSVARPSASPGGARAARGSPGASFPPRATCASWPCTGTGAPRVPPSGRFTRGIPDPRGAHSSSSSSITPTPPHHDDLLRIRSSRPLPTPPELARVPQKPNGRDPRDAAHVARRRAPPRNPGRGRHVRGRPRRPPPARRRRSPVENVVARRRCATTTRAIRLAVPRRSALTGARAARSSASSGSPRAPHGAVRPRGVVANIVSAVRGRAVERPSRLSRRRSSGSCCARGRVPARGVACLLRGVRGITGRYARVRVRRGAGGTGFVARSKAGSIRAGERDRRRGRAGTVDSVRFPQRVARVRRLVRRHRALDARGRARFPASRRESTRSSRARARARDATGPGRPDATGSPVEKAPLRGSLGRARRPRTSRTPATRPEALRDGSSACGGHLRSTAARVRTAPGREAARARRRLARRLRRVIVALARRRLEDAPEIVGRCRRRR